MAGAAMGGSVGNSLQEIKGSGLWMHRFGFYGVLARERHGRRHGEVGWLPRPVVLTQRGREPSS